MAAVNSEQVNLEGYHFSDKYAIILPGSQNIENMWYTVVGSNQKNGIQENEKIPLDAMIYLPGDAKLIFIYKGVEYVIHRGDFDLNSTLMEQIQRISVPFDLGTIDQAVYQGESRLSDVQVDITDDRYQYPLLSSQSFFINHEGLQEDFVQYILNEKTSSELLASFHSRSRVSYFDAFFSNSTVHHKAEVIAQESIELCGSGSMYDTNEELVDETNGIDVNNLWITEEENPKASLINEEVLKLENEQLKAEVIAEESIELCNSGSMYETDEELVDETNEELVDETNEDLVDEMNEGLVDETNGIDVNNLWITEEENPKASLINEEVFKLENEQLFDKLKNKLEAFAKLAHEDIDFTGLELPEDLALKVTMAYTLYSVIKEPPEELRKIEDSLIELLFQKATGYAIEHRDSGLETPYHFWGYNYCGPGTPLEKNISMNVPPVNNLDNICKQHDIDYKHIRTPLDALNADMKLMDGVFKLLSEKPSWSELFWSGIGFSLYYGIKKPLEKIGLLSPLFFTNAVVLSEEYMGQLEKKIESFLDKNIPLLMEYIEKTESDFNTEKLAQLNNLAVKLDLIRLKVYQSDINNDSGHEVAKESLLSSKGGISSQASPYSDDYQDLNSFPDYFVQSSLLPPLPVVDVS